MNHMEVNVKQIDVLPIVRHYMKSLDLYNVFKEYVPASSRCHLEHAEGLCVLVENLICCTKPLYKVEEWLSAYTDGLAEAPVEASIFNDDRLARDLSALFKADRHSMMMRVSLNAIKNHDLMTDEIHNDTTSITFKGRYESEDPDVIQLTYGYNKDYRPDCKQVVFGLNTTADGHVALSYDLFNGNTSDDTTHRPNWSGLRSLLEREDFIYIADCKLCSKDNLSYIQKGGGYFVTMVPKSWKVVKDFYNRMREEDIPWESAFTIESSRKKDKFIEYKAYDGITTEEGYRIVWVHSSGKEEDDRNRREKKIEKAHLALLELSGKLNRCRLKTQSQIKAAVDEICQATEEFICVKIVMDRKEVNARASRGRPGRNTEFKRKWEIKYRIEWTHNEHAIMEASRTDGVFPLITNTSFESKEVIRCYKRQPYIEKRMYTQKSVLEVAPIYIKKVERIEAIIFLYFIALMIISLIERNIRLNMAKESIEKLAILPQGMNTRKPTWDNVRYFFRNVILSEVVNEGISLYIAVKGFTPLHKRTVQLLGVPVSAYEGLQEHWWEWTGT